MSIDLPVPLMASSLTQSLSTARVAMAMISSSATNSKETLVGRSDGTSTSDMTEKLAADAQLAGLAVGDDALRRRQNMDALPAKDGLELLEAGVGAAAGLADAADFRAELGALQLVVFPDQQVA